MGFENNNSEKNRQHYNNKRENDSIDRELGEQCLPR